MDADKMLSMKQVAQILGMSFRTIQGWILKKILPFPAYRIGHEWRFRLADIQAYIDSVRTEALMKNYQTSIVRKKKTEPKGSS